MRLGFGAKKASQISVFLLTEREVKSALAVAKRKVAREGNTTENSVSVSLHTCQSHSIDVLIFCCIGNAQTR
jgi:hypothetical protein